MQFGFPLLLFHVQMSPYADHKKQHRHKAKHTDDAPNDIHVTSSKQQPVGGVDGFFHELTQDSLFLATPG
jgi:hypothetical protein